jgi:acyl-CoA thioesterase-1
MQSTHFARGQGRCDIDNLRVCFVGDSFIAGVGDPEHLGWTGRLAARSHRAGRPLTASNLGVRRQTSRDVSQRWLAECQQRLPEKTDGRIVVSFGVNDATRQDGAPRVPPDDSSANLAAVLRGAAALGWAALVVGPPPVADAEHNQRIAGLDDLFRTGCREADVPYVSIFKPLQSSENWTAEIQHGDGAHPAADGYQQLTDLWPAWRNWISSET